MAAGASSIGATGSLPALAYAASHDEVEDQRNKGPDMRPADVEGHVSCVDETVGMRVVRYNPPALLHTQSGEVFDRAARRPAALPLASTTSGAGRDRSARGSIGSSPSSDPSARTAGRRSVSQLPGETGHAGSACPATDLKGHDHAVADPRRLTSSPTSTTSAMHWWPRWSGSRNGVYPKAIARSMSHVTTAIARTRAPAGPGSRGTGTLR